MGKIQMMMGSVKWHMWAIALIVILLGFLANHSMVSASPNANIRRRHTPPRIIAEDERDKRGAGKLNCFSFILLFQPLVSDKFA